MNEDYAQCTDVSSMLLPKVAKELKGLLKELPEEKARIYTSMITVQEMSVAVSRRGAKSKDTYGDIHAFARIYGVSKDVALTAAHREAELKDYQSLSRDRARGRPKTKGLNASARIADVGGTAFILPPRKPSGAR